MYLLKLALRPWRQASMSQLFAATAVGFLLFLSGFMVWLERGLEPVVYRLSHEQVITAYLDASVEAKDEARIVDSIKIALGAQADRADVRMVGVQQFVADLAKHYPDLSHELEELGGEMNQVVPRHVSVSGILEETTVEHMRSVTGVESAESSTDRYHHIVGAFKTLRWVSRLIIAGTLLALLTGLIHLARMNAHLHEDAFSLLRLWGASTLRMKAPSLISGFGVGIIGGGIASAFWFFTGAKMAMQIRGLSPLLSEMPLPAVTISMALFLIGCMMGLISGLFISTESGADRMHSGR